MSGVAATVPGDLNPAFRSIPNLGIEPLAAQIPQQNALGATLTTVLGSVPVAGSNKAPVPGTARAIVRRVVFVPLAAVTGQNTNSFTLNVYKKTPGVAAVLVATISFTLGINAAQLEQAALTLQAAANVTLGPTDSLYVQQVQVGAAGLQCPAGVIQADCEPIGN